MPDKLAYEYAVIRLVPSVEREEFMNVGVILYSKDARFLDLRIHLDPQRIQAFAPAVDLPDIQGYLDAWAWICQGDPKGGDIAALDLPTRFRWLTAIRSTIIQSSRVHPGLCEQPAEVLDSLFHKYMMPLV